MPAPEPVIASYPVACQRLTSLGFSAESILNDAQAGDTQVLKGTRVTYLGLGQFALETLRMGRPPDRMQVPQQQAPRTVKVRRTGRHAAPSQGGRVAATAGKAVPAAALAGVALVAAAPQAHAEARVIPGHLVTRVHTPVTRVHTAAKVTRVRAAQAERTYTVQAGDTLSAIAQRLYHDGSYARWIQLYMANKGEIANPNLIYVGQVLKVPDAAAAHLTASYAPATHHTQPAGENENDDGSDGSGDEGGAQTQSGSHAQQSENENDGGSDGSENDGGSQAAATTSSQGSSSSGSTPLSGTLGCSGLEQLWQQAGGSPSAAVTAASVAMAESSGQQDPPSNAGSNSNGMTDVGYWQINSGFWPSLATADPMGNAKAAIQISHDGTDWTPWVTYQTGAYQGQC